MRNAASSSLILLAGLSAALAVSAARAQAAPSCSIFRGNLARTGELKTKALAELHGVKWKFKVGDKPQDLAWSYPLVADGLVFMGSADNNRGTQKYLHAVDVETGRERWRFPTATVVNRQPALEDVQGIHCLGDGLIYFTGESGYLYAVDPRTGKEAWRKLYVADGVVYFGDWKGWLYALH